MNKIYFSFIFSFLALSAFAQNADKLITAAEALRIESYLASDEMRGRKTGSPEIDLAADFISAEFKKSGLVFLPGLQSFKQTFTNVRAKFISAEGNADAINIEPSDIIVVTTDSIVKFNETSGYAKIIISNPENLLARAGEILKEKKNIVVFVNRFFSKDFYKLKRFKRDGPKTNYSVVFILKDAEPAVYNFEIRHKVTEMKLTNVVGILPGKDKKDEMVIFSAHYDHLGIGKTNAAGDSIYNGANDDAAGTTGVIMLANYFSKLKNNNRTLVFVAFTAEEIGGFGSQYFSKQINTDKTVAMFNLEMIGTESKQGKNNAYITGFDRSDLGKILQKNLEGSKFSFEADPYPAQNLFYRSDNATLASLGVPAHTISTSKMDIEPNYHKQSDEVSTLDMENMAEVIKAIALSSKTIISGKDTPTRVEKMK